MKEHSRWTVSRKLFPTRRMLSRRRMKSDFHAAAFPASPPLSPSSLKVFKRLQNKDRHPKIAPKVPNLNYKRSHKSQLTLWQNRWKSADCIPAGMVRPRRNIVALWPPIVSLEWRFSFAELAICPHTSATWPNGRSPPILRFPNKKTKSADLSSAPMSRPRCGHVARPSIALLQRPVRFSENCLLPQKIGGPRRLSGKQNLSFPPFLSA